MTIITIDTHVGIGLGVATFISNRHGYHVVKGKGGRSCLLDV